jgi:hypothetical protein
MQRFDKGADLLLQQGLDHAVAQEKFTARDHRFADFGFGHVCSKWQRAGTVSAACSDCNGGWRGLIWSAKCGFPRQLSRSIEALANAVFRKTF